MDYMTDSVNKNPIITKAAGTELPSVRGRAVKFDGTGKVVLAAAGEPAIGVGILVNSEPIAANDDVFVQVSAIGLVTAGAAIQAGDRLAPDANGALIPATSGATVALALQSAATAGELISAIIERTV